MADLQTLLRTLVHTLDLPESARKQIDELLAAHAPADPGAPITEVASPQGTALAALGPPPLDLAVDPNDPRASSPWARYEDLGRIGRGGMGEVRRVRDRVMGRVLAMKLLAHEALDTPAARARFLAEARLSASLQHPGIVPIHDCGVMPGGRLWFTMKEVHGRTLRAVIEALHERREAGPFPSAGSRFIDAYLRASEAVAYAHRRGILHRDLKPDNIMIGEFGEVLVMDWGLACAAPGALAAAANDLDTIAFAPSAQRGQVLGTPAYMPPEQARGEVERLGPASDVYALGAILYEVLCGSPPYTGTAEAIWAQVLHGAPEPVARRARGELPADLVAICERAMARDPAARFTDAHALAEEVREVQNGARRRGRALAQVTEARALAPGAAALRERAGALRAEAEAWLSRQNTFDPAEDKARGWALEDEARELARAAALEEVTVHQKLHAALHEAPELPEAHAALAEVHLADLRAAEATGDLEAAARAEALLRVHDRGRHAAWLRGDGALTLHTDPEGAEVWLFRYVERQRRRSAEPEGLLGRTPLREVPLPRGSYLLLIRAPGRREVCYPVVIGRGEHWDGVRPGDTEPCCISLLPEAELDEDDIYVPAGFCISGGDRVAGETLPLRRVWVDGFVLRRHPVTQAAYLAFLNDLVAAGRQDEAEAACPRVPRSIAGSVDVPLFPRGKGGLFQFGPQAPAGAARHPVVSVDWHSAMAAARWASRAGCAFRLPSEIEREKAARGVDGRFFPWGDQAEPTWACMVGSRPGAPSLVPVDAYPTDESPYGIRGLAGNTRDWCIEVWTPEGPPVVSGVVHVVPAAADAPGLRSVRGGAWMAPPSLCRAATRFAADPRDHLAGVGLRLARSVDPPRPGGR